MTEELAALRAGLQARAPVRSDAAAGTETSVALILAPTPAGLQTLLMERAQRPGDPWSGHISLPGGRREACDADRLGTAIRETCEETGVRLQPSDLIGELDDLQPRTPTYPDISVRPFVFALPKKPEVRPGPEAASCFWVDLRSLKEKTVTITVSIAGRPTSVPAFRLGQRQVWGITYRILSALTELL